MMQLVLATILPIALLIALGFALKKIRFVTDSYWQGAERIGYYILLPSLFVYGLATADLQGIAVKELSIVLLVSTLVSALLLFSGRRYLANDGPAFTSVFQGGLRFNNFIGVTLAAGLFGHSGIAMAAVANAIIVPTVNILCVLVFAKCGSANTSLKSVTRSIALNPLLIACVAGTLIHISGLKLPAELEATLKTLGQAALPLGLLCVGAALSAGALGQHFKPLALSSAFKFVILPLTTYAACRGLGLGGQAATIAVMFQALPTASSSYVMARQLGGDAPLMANIVAVQTLLAAIVLPIVITLVVP